MLRPTTVRVPEKLLKDLSRFVKEMNLDKSAYLREIIKKGFAEDRQERLLQMYQAGKLSLPEVCKKLDITTWDFLELLKRRGINLNVSLEDWLDTVEL
jgi:predicted HTH domain antitoxin